MKNKSWINKLWIFDIALFVLWSIAFLGNLISGDIHVLSYVFLYVAFLCELLKNFIMNFILKNAEIEIIKKEPKTVEENNNEH